MKITFSSALINLKAYRKEAIFRLIKNVLLRKLPLFLLMITCSNPIEPNQNAKFHFIFTEGFNQSKTTLTLSTTMLMDSIITSRMLAPNSGSSHWFAAEGEIVFQKGTYNFHVKTENIEKDTTIALNDSLFAYIAFLRDSLKIEIAIKNKAIIYM